MKCSDNTVNVKDEENSLNKYIVELTWIHVNFIYQCGVEVIIVACVAAWLSGIGVGVIIVACVATWLSGVSVEWDVTRLCSSMAMYSSRCCADRFTSYLFIFVS